MNVATRLGSYTALLGLALAGGLVVGAALGPEPDDDAPAHDPHGDTTDDVHAPGAPAGLSMSERGYTLRLETTELLATGGPLQFTVTGPDGEPVRDFAVEHEKELHLIVASRDLSRYAHLHPVRDDTGRWTADLPALDAGPYRLFADFRPADGPALTLGVDAVVAGDYRPPARPDASTTTTVDGFDVTLTGEPAPGEDASLVVQVRRANRAVELQPYLGANGHLVALREGDLAYLHVHPEHGDTTGDVPFTVHFPTAGRYRLFFDFQVDGVVRTADFTVDIGHARHG
ncbi:MAG TPA: heavy-metal-associated domain-containing protein [Acidimicrobiales bacterium]